MSGRGDVLGSGIYPTDPHGMSNWLCQDDTVVHVCVNDIFVTHGNHNLQDSFLNRRDGWIRVA